MVIPSILCFSGFVTVSYRFPWCFHMFSMVYLRFPLVFLRFPLSVSPASHCRFCDLETAKIAKRIQRKEAPQFNNVFIIFGSFHIETTFFSSLGRIIEDSGGPYILSESFVVAIGSMNKFLRGKVYNKCRRCRILLSAASHGLNLKQIFEHNYIYENFINELESWKNVGPEVDRFKHLFERYVTYMEETMASSHGKTAQFWINYVYVMDMTCS